MKALLFYFLLSIYFYIRLGYNKGYLGKVFLEGKGKGKGIGMAREIGERANRELGERKGLVTGKSFLFSNTEKGFIPSWILDKNADIQIEGPYRDRRDSICPNCFTRRSKNKTCFC